MANKKTKITALILALSLCLGLLSGCGSDKVEETPEEEQGVAIGKELEDEYMADRVFTLNYEKAASINPIKAESSENMMFAGLVYDTMFVVDENFEVSSNIVVDYQSSDFEWWVFDIDTSVMFHDGTTLTAKDVAYSINRAMRFPYYSGRLDCIYGVSALDEDTLAISTTYPNAQFITRLTIPIIKYDSMDDYAPPGTGPYMFSEESESLVLFEENPRSADMPLDEIFLADYTETTAKISAFEDSRIDIVTNDPTGMFNLGYGSSNESRFYNTTNFHYLGFNMESLFFTSSAMRYAMMYAVDRENLVKNLMDDCGLVTTLPVSPISPLYNSTYAENYGYDMKKCESIFRNANIADHDYDGALEFVIWSIIVEINIKFIVNNDSSVKVQTARQIAEDLNAIGITTTLYELDWDDYIDALQRGDYDMYYGEIRMTPDWNLGYLFDPEDFKTRGEKPVDEDDEEIYPDVGMNYSGCGDPAYTQLYNDYLAADELTRYDKYQEVCRYVIENGGIVPICFEKREVLTHRGIVSGVNPTQYNLFNDFENWNISFD